MRMSLLEIAVRILMVAVLVLCAPLGALEIDNPRFGFKVRIPESFQQWPLGRPMPSSSTLHAFVLGDVNDTLPDVVLGIEHLGGVIGREGLNESDIPKGFGGSDYKVEKMKWGDFEIDVLSMSMNTQGFAIRSFAAQVPLKKEAIQINIAGEISRQDEVRGYLQFVLDHLEGDSNWLSGSERVAKLTEGLLKLGFFLALVVGGVFLFVRSRRRKAALVPVYYPGYPPAGPGAYPAQRGYGPPGYPPGYPPGAAVAPPQPGAPAPAYPAAQIPAAQPTPEPAGPKCGSCGAPTKPGRRNCIHCGAAI